MLVFKSLTKILGKALTVSDLIIQLFSMVIPPTNTSVFAGTTSSQLLVLLCKHLQILKSSALSLV